MSFEGNGALLDDNPPFSLAVSLTAGANAAASLQNPFPDLPPNSSFPNFVSDYATGSTFWPGTASCRPPPLPIRTGRSRRSSNMVLTCSISTSPIRSQLRMQEPRVPIWLWDAVTTNLRLPTLRAR